MEGRKSHSTDLKCHSTRSSRAFKCPHKGLMIQIQHWLYSHLREWRVAKLYPFVRESWASQIQYICIDSSSCFLQQRGFCFWYSGSMLVNQSSYTYSRILSAWIRTILHVCQTTCGYAMNGYRTLENSFVFSDSPYLVWEARHQNRFYNAKSINIHCSDCLTSI
jgi:hypothetical protein